MDQPDGSRATAMRSVNARPPPLRVRDQHHHDLGKCSNLVERRVAPRLERWRRDGSALRPRWTGLLLSAMSAIVRGKGSYTPANAARSRAGRRSIGPVPTAWKTGWTDLFALFRTKHPRPMSTGVSSSVSLLEAHAQAHHHALARGMAVIVRIDVLHVGVEGAFAAHRIFEATTDLVTVGAVVVID